MMMKRYIFDSRGYYVRTISVSKFDTFPPNSTTVAPPSLPARWDNTQWHGVDNVPVVEVKRKPLALKDFKLALLDADLLDTVTAHIQSLPGRTRKRVQIELENGGNITLKQAKTLLKGVINDNVIEQIFIDGG